MADTIKTQIMRILKEAFETIPEVNTVFRVPTTGVDLDTAKPPTLFFYDDTEPRAKRNRLMEGNIRLVVGVYVPFLLQSVDAGELADTIQARIHRIMMVDALTGNPLINKTEEVEFSKDYPNDEYLLLVGIYNVTYLHKYGDGFSQSY